jgi:hypothetical protein
MTKNLIWFVLVPIFVGIGIAVAGLLLPAISAELVMQHRCDSVNSVCAIGISSLILGGVFIAAGIVLVVGSLGIENKLSKLYGIEVIFDNNDKRCRHHNNPGHEGKSCYYFCLKIVNKSNRSATNCVGRLDVITDDRGTPCSDWISSHLCWERQPQDKPTPITIDPKGTSVLDIGWVNKGEDKFKLRTDQSAQGINVHRPKGKYYLSIVVSADGFDTVKQWFRVEWFRDYDDFKMYKVSNLRARA